MPSEINFDLYEMRPMKTKMIFAALASFIMTGCSNEVENLLSYGERTPLQVKGSMEMEMTRAQNDTWENGDAIGVYMLRDDNTLAEGVKNLRYVTANADGNFSAEGSIAFLPDDGSIVTVKAYYPQSNVDENNCLSIDLTNQTVQNAIDLMSAQCASVSKDAPTASLNFTHKLAKIVLNITAGEGVILDGMQVRISNQKPSVRYNVLTDEVVAEGDAADIMLRFNGTDRAEGILVPNNDANPATERLLTFLLNGMEYTATIPQSIVFNTGTKICYNVNFKINAGEPTGVEISGATINNWTEGPATDDIEIEIPTGPVSAKRAPLYWSIYEYCWQQSKTGVSESDMDMSREQWIEVADWMKDNLLPYGYDMLCTDGFIPMLSKQEPNGYMDYYGSMPLKELVEIFRQRGLKLGVYDNPLWLHGQDGTPVPNTSLTQKDLKYNAETDKVLNDVENDLWFTYLVATHPGAEEYIDGFFKYYKDLGVDYIRMDFLSWYEDGKDRGMDIVGRGYGRECYELALKYIHRAATKYGIFTSLVMPHLNNGAELEQKYGDMVRIVADTGDGGWGHCSDIERGTVYDSWPNCMNMYDGFAYWSKVSGRGKLILDGDFIRLNTFSTDDEKQSVISLQLMAGGPVTVADQPSTIGDNLKFYTNEEVLALNRDGFVGKPLDAGIVKYDYPYADEHIKKHQIWYGQMSDGDWIICIFNREGNTQHRYVDLKWFGLEDTWKIRDLWTHTDEGENWKIEADIPAHGCKMVRVSKK